ncbi:MAG: hypothetical protein ACUZ8H_01285 [Candidatus Anammoxibacter sp.]
MRFKMSYKKIVMFASVFMMISLLLVNYTFSALTSRKSNELRIAYANGYYAALQLSIAEIEELKNDEKALKQKTRESADAYLEILSKMN